MNCKPGDMAIIMKAPLSKDGAPIGMIVEVTNQWATDRRFGHCWWCIVPRKVETVGLGLMPACHIADDWLRPVSGLPITDDVIDEVTA